MSLRGPKAEGRAFCTLRKILQTKPTLSAQVIRYTSNVFNTLTLSTICHFQITIREKKIFQSSTEHGRRGTEPTVRGLLWSDRCTLMPAALCRKRCSLRGAKPNLCSMLPPPPAAARALLLFATISAIRRGQHLTVKCLTHTTILNLNFFVWSNFLFSLSHLLSIENVCRPFHKTSLLQSVSLSSSLSFEGGGVFKMCHAPLGKSTDDY